MAAPRHLRGRSVLPSSTPQFSQFLVMSDKLSEATIQADQQSRDCRDRGRYKILRTREVDIEFRRERTLID
jgi:hypothetical protein